MAYVSRHTRNAHIQKLLLCCSQLPKLEIHSDYKSTHCGNAVKQFCSVSVTVFNKQQVERCVTHVTFVTCVTVTCVTHYNCKCLLLI